MILRNVVSDAFYAIRIMTGRPGFTAVVVLTLAVGIGATTAMFGLYGACFPVDAVELLESYEKGEASQAKIK